MRVLVTGASGFIGSALASCIERAGDEVVRLRRGPEWDPERGVMERKALEGVDAVVNLAGENLFSKRWTDRQKRRIMESRLGAARLIVDGLAGAERRPAVLVSASAVGYYGDRGDEILSEDAGCGSGFLSEVCRQWESEALRARDLGVRVVAARFGVVLQAGGGILGKILPLARLGLAGPLGRGNQYVSWISMRDAVGAIRFAMENEWLEGPVNLVSPNPVSNAELMRAIGRVLRRPSGLRVPAPVLRLAVGRERCNETLLAGARVVPKRLLDAGYRFQFPDLQGALAQALHGDSAV